MKGLRAFLVRLLEGPTRGEGEEEDARLIVLMTLEHERKIAILEERFATLVEHVYERPDLHS